MEKRGKLVFYFLSVLTIFVLLTSFSSFVLAATDDDPRGLEPRGGETYDEYQARVAAASAAGSAAGASGGAALGSGSPSAAAARIQGFINDAYIVAKPILEVIVGTTANGSLQESTIFFAKVLLLILVFSIVFVILDKAGGDIFSKGWLKFLISFFVAILGVRFLDAELIETIILPNQAFLVAVTAGLPFVLFYLAVKNFPSSTQRRLAWVFFSAIFAFIWLGRYNELGDARWIYPVAALLGLLMIIFDGTFAKFRSQVETEKIANRSAKEKIRDLRRDLVKLQDDYKDGILGKDKAENDSEYTRLRKEIMDKINTLRSI